MPIDTEYLIIGQGIAGTMLSYLLEQQGKSFIVIDDGKQQNASKVAGAVINPASGKNWTPARDQELFLPEALAAYKAMSTTLGSTLLHASQLMITHRDPMSRQLFESKVTRAAPFLERCPDQQQSLFDSPYGLGCIRPVYRVATQSLLALWRSYLSQSGRLIEAVFDPQHCTMDNDIIRYQDITAAKIIYCEGAAGRYNSLFPAQPFTANRGEALLLSIPGLPDTAVYQGPLRLIPEGNGLFWCGSNYKWDFSDLLPDEAWRLQATRDLRQWLRLPFTVEDHIVAERPTTAGQRQLSLQHPQYPNVYMFNGLGTRGFSAAPYLAAQLIRRIG